MKWAFQIFREDRFELLRVFFFLLSSFVSGMIVASFRYVIAADWLRGLGNAGGDREWS